MTQDTTSSARTAHSALAGSSTNGGNAHHSARAPEQDYFSAPEIMAASSFEGDSVVTAQGEHVGEIEEIMIDVCAGRVAYAVISIGGFLGIGEKFLAIPWRALTLDTDNAQFILDVDAQRMKDAPIFDKEHWPSMSDEQWAHELHEYYRTRPYWER
jgi:sporulation protein YlmC with PRC-barrel domain